MAQTFYPITPTEIVPSADDDWVTMDASALAPEGTTGVIVHVVNTNQYLRYVGLRKNGSTDNRFADMTGETGHWWAMIGVDASRIFEAYVENTTDIDIYVVGYTKAGVTFKTNADDMSLAGIGNGEPIWQDIDCSTEAPSAIGLIWEILSASVRQFGLRKNGSSDDRYYTTDDHRCFGAIIGCDASQICEGYIESTDVDFFLVGYITDGCTFNTNADDVSLGANSAWTNLAALPSGANMGFIEVTNDGGDIDYGLRKDGSAEDIYGDIDSGGHSWGIIEAASLIIEGKIASTDIDFFVVGYSIALISKTSSETGSGADVKASGNPLATYARSETGSGVEAMPARGITLPDSGSGVDALTSLLVALIRSDIGSGLDSTLKEKIGSDSGVGADTILGFLDRVLTEYGYGVDTAKFGDRPVLGADVGLGIEISHLRELGEPKYSSDDGSGVDASTLASLLTRADDGVATEAIVLLAAILAGDDGQGVDALVEVTATIKDIITSDAGQGVDEVLTYLRKLVDSGEGVENLHLVGYVGRRMRMTVYQKEAFDLKAYTSETGK